MNVVKCPDCNWIQKSSAITVKCHSCGRSYKAYKDIKNSNIVKRNVEYGEIPVRRLK